MVTITHYEQAPIVWFSQTHEHISREVSAIETDLNHPGQSFTLDELSNKDIRSSIIKIKSEKLIELEKNIKKTQELFISLPKKEDPYFTDTQQKLEEIFKLIKREKIARIKLQNAINSIKNERSINGLLKIYDQKSIQALIKNNKQDAKISKHIINKCLAHGVINLVKTSPQLLQQLALPLRELIVQTLLNEPENDAWLLALVTDTPSDAYNFLDEERNFTPYKEKVHYFSDYEVCIIINGGTPYPFQFDKERNAYSSIKPLDWDLEYSENDDGFIKSFKRDLSPTESQSTTSNSASDSDNEQNTKSDGESDGKSPIIQTIGFA